MLVRKIAIQSAFFEISCAVVFAWAITSSLVHAQSSAPQPPQSAPAAATPADPRHITIDVQVTDSFDKHVGGLEVRDFSLSDNRQSVQIVDLHEVDSRNPAASPLHVVIVLDMINAEFRTVAKERAQLANFLKGNGGRLAYPTSLAMLTEKGLNTDKLATTDGAVLAGSLSKFPTVLRTADASTGFYGSADQMRWSLGELGQLAQNEATLPGRKLFVVVSPGWPILEKTNIDATPKERQWIFASIVALSNGLRKAHIVLYALDPSQFELRNPYYYRSFLKGVPKIENAEYANLALQVLAAHSGGIAQPRSLDLQAEIDKAIRDAETYYSVTFEAPSAAGANEYHDLNLQADKPEAIVRTTSGYYANLRP